MNKALHISSMIAIAIAAATSHAAQSECNRLSAGPARAACMQSNIRPDGVDAGTVGRAITHGTMRPGADAAKPALSADLPSPPSAGSDQPGVGATSGAGAQAEGRLNLQTEPAITHSGPDAASPAPQ